MIYKKDVPFFEPYTQLPFVFKKDLNFKRFLLAKLINAEYSSLKAPAFSQYSMIATKSSLELLCDDLKESNLRFNNFSEIEAASQRSKAANRRSKFMYSNTPSKESDTKALSRQKKFDEESDNLTLNSPSITEHSTTVSSDTEPKSSSVSNEPATVTVKTSRAPSFSQPVKYLW